MRKYALLLVLVEFLAPVAAQSQPTAVPVVKTKQGQIQGVQEGNLHVFRGIPYAQPPIGKLRFQPPQPVRKHAGVVPAVAFGNKAVQAGGPTGVQGSEDCLYLNVWAPTAAARRPRPVVVWVHGGAFTGGSGQDNDAWTFAAQDTIVAVSINYRLGSLGFLQLGSQLGRKYQRAGNAGLLDAVAALRWVQQNIAAFGGDPHRVTVMGESAGAKLVGGLLAAPATQGLFQQVILESGAVQAVRDTATAAAVTRQLQHTLHRPNARALLALPADSLVRAQAQFASGAGGLQVFGPVQDGLTISTPPLDYLRERQPPLRVLLGTNLEEARLFSGPGSVLHQPNEAALQAVFGAKNSPYVWQAYQQRRQQQPDLDAWNSVLTDYLYRLATYRLANQLAAQGGPTWLYRFDYADATTQPWHAQELNFVWNAPAGSSAASTATRAVPLASKASNPALAATMHAYWAQFIKTGTPGPAWPAYTPEQRKVMLFKANSQPEPIPTPYEDPTFPVQGYKR
ncbi:carboxylesterase/lipase family protein [Hymenobacter sp. BT186]|uniref:Carboxylic ester hydrolase n=1 Tax=Hymenobacter telluris TaxID=2816474 RepID=A0A939EZV7_9BACT|nr:carboxylesterase family protein [Hymenobacter telluris]MBO0358898.1 carboxylesterase/lipase family protein [Hymenobacter telluris]MBW3374924.1 carboxylesterase family protein [Hymenobacter norwichensis]